MSLLITKPPLAQLIPSIVIDSPQLPTSHNDPSTIVHPAQPLALIATDPTTNVTSTSLVVLVDYPLISTTTFAI